MVDCFLKFVKMFTIIVILEQRFGPMGICSNRPYQWAITMMTHCNLLDYVCIGLVAASSGDKVFAY